MTDPTGIFCTDCGATARRPGHHLTHHVGCGLDLGAAARHVRRTNASRLELGHRADIAAANEMDAHLFGPDAVAYALFLRCSHALAGEAAR